MARFEMADAGSGAMGESKPNAEDLFELGMIYSSGTGVETDLVAAHKWFNLAAMRGNSEAVHYRREVALEMDDQDIAAAQRAAREWLTTH